MKAFKVELLVLDFDKLGEEGLRSAIENAHYPNRCVSPSVMAIESREIDWSDHHPLNLSSKANAEYERLFGRATITQGEGE